MLSVDERRLLDQMPGPLIASGAGGMVLYANRPACALLHYEALDALVGRPLQSLMPKRMRDKHQQGFSRYRRTGRSHLLGKRIRVIALTKDETEIGIELCIRMYRRHDGTDLIIGAFTLADSGEDYIDMCISRIEDDLEDRAYIAV